MTVRLRGEERTGHAEVIEDNGAVAEYIEGFVERNGLENAGRLALSFREDELPDRDVLSAGLDEVAVVEIELADA